MADSERDSAPKLLKVNFNDDVGIMGGVGFNIRKFFFDFRLSGYARSHVWNTFVSDGVSQRVSSSSEQKSRVRRRTLFLHNK